MEITKIEQAEKWRNDNFKDAEISRFESNYPGYVIIKSKYKSLEDLENDWNNFIQLGYDAKMLCDDKSITLFGFKNEERYTDMRAMFLRNNIDHADIIDDLTNLYSFTENAEFDSTNNIRIADSYIYNIRGSNDITECVLYYNRIEDIEKTDKLLMKDLAESVIDKKIGDKEFINPKMDLGIYSPQLLPEEVETMLTSITEEKEWFNNYKAKRYGIKPVMENFYTYHSRSVNSLLYEKKISEKSRTSLIEFGCFPFKCNDRKNNRVNSIIATETSKFKFIDIAQMSGTINEEYIKIQSTLNNGITIFYITGDKKDEVIGETPNILVSLDTHSKFVYPIIEGDLQSPKPLEIFLNNYTKDSYMTVYFLPILQNTLNKIRVTVDAMLKKVSRTRKNFLRDVCNSINTPIPDIGNIKLNYYYLINSILLFDTNKSSNDIELTTNNFKIFDDYVYSYNIFHDELSNFKAEELYSPLYAIESLEDKFNIESIKESYRPYVKMIPLKEDVETIIKDEQFAINTEKNTILYNVIKNTENLDLEAEYKKCKSKLEESLANDKLSLFEFYLCEMYFLKTKIEEKLHYDKNQDLLKSLYLLESDLDTTFAHYINQLYYKKPELDFEEVYRNSIFAKETSFSFDKMKRVLWDYISNLLNLTKL